MNEEKPPEVSVEAQCEDCTWHAVLAVGSLGDLQQVMLAAEALLQEHRFMDHGDDSGEVT